MTDPRTFTPINGMSSKPDETGSYVKLADYEALDEMYEEHARHVTFLCEENNRLEKLVKEQS